jgi:hypothetical protein
LHIDKVEYCRRLGRRRCHSAAHAVGIRSGCPLAIGLTRDLGSNALSAIHAPVDLSAFFRDGKQLLRSRRTVHPPAAQGDGRTETASDDGAVNDMVNVNPAEGARKDPYAEPSCDQGRYRRQGRSFLPNV